mgnify:CR=1 FL=1
MRRLIGLLFGACLTASGLSGCNHNQGQNAAGSQAQISKPANPNDAAAWEAYMVKIGAAHAQAAGDKPYLFIVPSGDDPAARDRRQMIQHALADMASRNSFPGNTIVVGGPDPGMTTQVIKAAFDQAKPGTLKAETVLYVGDDTDKDIAQKTIEASGATFRYVKM